MARKWIFNPFSSTLDAIDVVSATVMEWQDSVLDKDVTDPSTLSPSVDDRYLIGTDPTAGTAVGDWSGHDGDIATYTAVGWSFVTPTTGMALTCDDEQEAIYLFDGSDWIARYFERTTASNGLTISGVDVRVNFETVNPTLQIVGVDELAVKYGDGFSQDANGLILVADSTGGANLATSIDINSNGIAIKIDDSTIKENVSNQLYVDPANVDHDQLLNFVANEHIDHTTVSISAGGILSGGGDISANRTISLNHGDVDHDQTTNFVANEHIDHTAVSISAGGILSGGGDISSDRTITLNHSDVDHDQTTNFVANEHIDHTAVSISAGGILSGGGDISSNRTITLNHSDVDHDQLLNFVANEHIDHSAVSIATAASSSGLSGGGDITSTRNLVVDINGTTDKASPVSADEILISDSEDGNNLKKVDLASIADAVSGAPGDIQPTSFIISNNQSTPANVTGLAFSNAVVRSAQIHYSIVIDADSDLYEVGTIRVIQKGASWDIDQTSSGDDSLISFSITSAGQIQYTSSNYTGFVDGQIDFRAITTDI